MKGSMRAYARHREAANMPGGTLRAVQKAIQSGRIAVGADGQIDFVAADSGWKDNTDPARTNFSTHHGSAQMAGTKQTTSSSVLANNASYIVARALRESYAAQQAKLNYEASLGKMVDRDKEQSRGRMVANETREAILSIPDRIADILAAESRGFKIHELLTTELIGALERLANVG